MLKSNPASVSSVVTSMDATKTHNLKYKCIQISTNYKQIDYFFCERVSPKSYDISGCMPHMSYWITYFKVSVQITWSCEHRHMFLWCYWSYSRQWNRQWPCCDDIRSNVFHCSFLNTNNKKTSTETLNFTYVL